MDSPVVKQMNSMDVGLISTDATSLENINIPEVYSQSLKTYIPHIDAIFEKLVPGSVIAIGAEPGTGKTTFFLQLAGLLSKGKPDHIPVEIGFNPDAQKVCFISGEQNIAIIKMTADRIHASGFDVKNDTSLESVVKLIESKKYGVVVIDSMNCLSSPLVTGAHRTRVNNVNKIKEAADHSHTIVFMICHSTKAGEIRGGNDVTHPIDAVFLIHTHNDKTKKLFMGKNRNGPAGSAYLNMTATGFDLYNEVDPTTGLSVADALKKEMYIRYMVDTMDANAALSEDDLYELCDAHNLCVDTAKKILGDLVLEDKVIWDDGLWIVDM
jgi:predicted ATP-dependent serine protease